MNTIATRRPAAPQPQVSAVSRIATAIAVAAVLTIVWVGAEQASHQAVQTATQAIAGSTTHVTLPAVEIVGRRETATGQSI